MPGNHMIYFLYTALFSLAVIPGALWLALTPRHRPLLARLRPPIPRQSAQPLWVHACSFGEVRTVTPILKAIAAAWPEIPIVLTVSTVSGRNLANDTQSLRDSVTWLPFDHPWLMRAFIRRLRPRALVIVETELWPALLRETANARVPIAIVNGRLSDKHFARNQRFRSLLRPYLRHIDAAAVQDEIYRDRFAQLGVPTERITVTGSTKFDAAPNRSDLPDLNSLRAACGIPDHAPVLVFGSTRPGDEDRAAKCWQSLRETSPELRLVIAPRHPARLNEAIRPLPPQPYFMRSKAVAGIQGAREPIIVVDTLGELTHFYALATVAVVGGSFSEDVQGHNPLEPAALGIATVFGPCMGNFTEAVRLLLDAQGAVQVGSDAALLDTLRELLANPQRRSEIAAAAQRAIDQNKGAIANTIKVLRPFLEI